MIGYSSQRSIRTGVVKSKMAISLITNDRLSKPTPKQRKVVKKAQKKITKKLLKNKTLTAKKSLSEQLKSIPSSSSQSFESLIKNYIHPVYPRIALKRELTGKVTLKLFLNSDGSVNAVKILKSSGHKSLDNAAKKAAKRWAFDSSSSLPESINKKIVFTIK